MMTNRKQIWFYNHKGKRVIFKKKWKKQNIIIIIIPAFLCSQIFWDHHRKLSDSKFPELFSTLLSIYADQNNAAVFTISTFCHIPTISPVFLTWYKTIYYYGHESNLYVSYFSQLPGKVLVFFQFSLFFTFTFYSYSQLSNPIFLLG